jgi:hypothetical protein
MTKTRMNVTIGYVWYGDLIEDILANPAAGTRL